MRPEYCDITLVIDESGSMAHLQTDTIGGINRFLAEQRRLPGLCRVTIKKFNTGVVTLCQAADVRTVADLNYQSYVPCGGTALLDALGDAIDEAGQRFRIMSEWERPSKVVVVVVTDGQENSSHRMTKAAVGGKVSLQQHEYQWEFVFMGANIDAFAEGGSLGFFPSNTLQYTSSHLGTASAYHAMTANVSNFRSGTTATTAFTQGQRDEQSTGG